MLKSRFEVSHIVKQIQRFSAIKEAEEFLLKHQNAEFLVGEHYSIQRDTTYILSAGDKKIKSVPRPRERPYQIPVIYVVYEKEGRVDGGETAKIKIFTFSNRIEEINAFLSTHHATKIMLIPTTEFTPPLDNYYCGEYGPVPDRQPMQMKTHQILVVYRD